MKPFELWGGHECTVNRVGDRYFDQTVRSGHEDRASDLRLFADLGIRSLRYPVLWERISPDRPDERDFAWTDERLAEIRRLGMRPIAGLTHHGSGPRWTSLLDDEGFASGLAAHARAVAERYPWLEAYTPVNEPLTTARFSALYGFWYPHASEEGALWRAVLNQIDATRLSMREIRRVNPLAQLVQTEDLGHCHATPKLAYQAEFENHRRWITWDLLCGRVTEDHPLFDRIAAFGLGDRLRAVADDPCPPDVVGVNHYLSSERFLDEAVENYPEHLWGGNGVHRYVDVEAVRVSAKNALGFEALLAETSRRYGLPVAVTECHNGCTREEQMRWIYETWRGCERLREEGHEIVALTAWSLIGSIDWNSLLTKEANHYEPGVYDLRGGDPRPTAVVDLLRSLSGKERPKNIALSSPGWWKRDIRFAYGRKVERIAPTNVARRDYPAPLVPARPILITGATGTLGRAFARACQHRGLPFVVTDRAMLSIEDHESIRLALDELTPSAVINTAGWVRVDEAEADPDGCMAANAIGAENLARGCKRLEVPYVTFSSDLVFDGAKGAPYVETDAPAPLNVYGRSKAEAERRVLALGGRALVVRTSAFFQPFDAHNFAVHVMDTLHRGETFRAAEDRHVSPTYVPDLVDATLDLLLDGATGVWHLANSGRVSWADFARKVADKGGLDAALIEGAPAESFEWAAERPLDVSLASERGQLLPALESAIDRFLSGYSPPAGFTRELCPGRQPDAVELADAAE